MSTNRIVRIVVGLALVLYGVYSQIPWFYLGLLPLITGVINWCPLETKMGTCDPASGCCATPTKDDKAQSCCSVNTNEKSSLEIAKKQQNISWSSPNATKIEILGTGCAKCITLEKIVREVVSKLDGDYQVIKVDDINEIMSYNIVSTPGLVINGSVVSTGKVLSADEIKKFIQEKTI